MPPLIMKTNSELHAMRPVKATINLTALAHNLAQVKKLAPLSRIVSVIKANAYGHGVLPVARALSKSKPINQVAARKHLIDRLDLLSKKHGFNYNRVFIKNQKTRWGSCSGKNNINLNINLIRLPDELMDYTILHELVHTRVKNHGRRFWNQMDKLVGDAKKLDSKLSEYRVLLI